MEMNLSDYQFVQMGHFLPFSANRKHCAAAIVGLLKFDNYLQSGGIAFDFANFHLHTSPNLPEAHKFHKKHSQYK